MTMPNDNVPNRLRVVACGVFEPELHELIPRVDEDIDLELLDAGLHSEPDRLRREVQQVIDHSSAQEYDAVVACYGLCGRGTSGLVAREIPVILLRVHDCITLFLGSRSEYMKQFQRHPGTFYITPGWYQKKVRSEEGDDFDHRSLQGEADARFVQWAEQFGEQTARWLGNFYNSWKRNYTRAAYIDTLEHAPEEYAEYTRSLAESMGWEYERIEGRHDLLRRVLESDWDSDDVLVLRPGQTSVATGDGRILDSQAARQDRPAQRDTACEDDQLVEDAPPAQITALGIDAGGTYTDCVAYDFGADRLVAKSKALTTHYDLMVGIEDALDSLPVGAISGIEMVALSTTLATNSIVEDRGGRPGAILMAPGDFAEDAVDWPHTRIVPGAMSVTGDEIEPMNAFEVRDAVRQLIDEGCDAFAVSGYASVRNPEHEQQIQRIIGEMCDLPVVCGHHLSTELDFTTRATTAILNARLLSVIRELLEAVKEALALRGVDAPVMVVKGDGSLINEDTARRRPVETVLSGPAASVIGARFLTDIRDGLVLDMGGTTTDTARVSDGLPELHPRGATVNGWRLSVAATDIATVGLGGDSHVDFNAERDLLVGPRRAVPLAYIAAHSEQAKRQIHALDAATIQDRSSAAALDLFTTGRPPNNPDMLTQRQRRILEALSDGPLSRAALARSIGLQSSSLLRTEDLQASGYIQRAALTPTDILHTTGQFTRWDTSAAQHALGVFSALYGAPESDVAEGILEQVVQKLCMQILLASYRLPQHEQGDCDCPLCQTILNNVLAKADGQAMRISCDFADELVAIGAPVRAFFPQVAQRLHAGLSIPEHAEVANAIGAVASEVVAHERVIIRPGEIGNYVVHSRDARTEYVDLEEAVMAARQEAADIARRRATEAGAPACRARVDVDRRRVRIADGSIQLVEVTVDATAAGRPTIAPR